VSSWRPSLRQAFAYGIILGVVHQTNDLPLWTWIVALVLIVVGSYGWANE
jgi:hypothetical protein